MKNYIIGSVFGVLVSIGFNIAFAQLDVSSQAGEVYIKTADEKIMDSSLMDRSTDLDREHFCWLRSKFGTYRDFDEFLACRELSNIKALTK